jgi:ribosomal protein L10
VESVDEMPTPRKSEQIDKIKAAFEKSGAVYFADLSKLTAVEMTDLRRKLRKGTARVLKDASQSYKEWKFKGAFIEQALYTAEQFDLLAAMPTKPELHGQLVGVLMGPLYQLAMVLEDIMGSFVRVLDEVKEQRAGQNPV